MLIMVNKTTWPKNPFTRKLRTEGVCACRPETLLSWHGRAFPTYLLLFYSLYAMTAVFLCAFGIPDYTHNRILLGLTTPLQNVGES